MSMRAVLRSRRELAVLAGFLVLVIGLAVLVERYLPPQQRGQLLPTLSVHSSRGDGARALSLWLAELGFRPAPIEYRTFAIDPQVRLLFVLAPGDNLVEAHASEIVGWIERGGILVLVADKPNPLLHRLGVEIKAGSARLAEAVPRQPLFLNPPVGRVEVERSAALRLLRPEWVPLLGAAEPEGDTVAAVATIGRGRAFVLAAQAPLSNAGLGRADNGMLALHFLAAVPPGSTIAFDEYHHGLTEHGTLGARLFGEPWGWAVLYSGGLLFAYVALRGRRFGRAISPSSAGPRRSRAEYVATLAGLLRQGRHRRWLCQQYTGQVKRALGSRYRLRTDLPAADFVAALAAQRPEAAVLTAPLERLERDAPVDDATVVALMREVDRLRAALLGS